MNLILIILLLCPTLAFADTFEKISDTQVKRTTEEVQDVQTIYDHCQEIKDLINKASKQLQTTIDDYSDQYDKCQSDIDQINKDTGVSVADNAIDVATNSEEFR